jgi:glucosyl-dolichyl phosphate glucuronosyltransferase
LEPDISVCICTRDRPRYLRSCLDALAAQTSSGFEILVVDSASPPVARAEAANLVATAANARLILVDEPGLGRARNAGAAAASGTYIAYLDDDAIPAPDWIDMIRRVIAERARPPAMVGGRILPLWEAPLPDWWPRSLIGVLSIVEWDGRGVYRTPDVPSSLEPFGANIVVRRDALLSAGGFETQLGRSGSTLLSDEEVQLAWRLQDSGEVVLYDGRVLVHHQIQASRLTIAWLLQRLYWQGISTVLSRRRLGRSGSVWKEVPRRLAVAALFSPLLLWPATSHRFVAARWRLAYARGFLGVALQLHHLARRSISRRFYQTFMRGRYEFAAYSARISNIRIQNNIVWPNSNGLKKCLARLLTLHSSVYMLPAPNRSPDMSGRVTLELFRRSLFFRFQRTEFYAEWRGRGWPRLWTWSNDVESRELWLGRIYLCLSRSPQPELSEEAEHAPPPVGAIEPGARAFGSPITRATACAPVHLRLVHSAER